MREVSVIGVGMVPFAKYREKTLAEIGWPAVKAAIEDAGVEKRDIEAAYCGSALGGMMSGQRVLKQLGITGLPITNVENACSSSSSAFRQAYIAVAAGVYDMVLVLGVEKLTKFGGGTLPLEKEDFEVTHGLVMPALYGMRARRYMHDYGLTKEQLAQVAVKAHKHGAKNEDAQYRNEVTVEEVMEAREIAEPFTLLHCCPSGDGAAAVVIASAEKARQYTTKPVRVACSEVNSGKYVTGFRDMTTPEITVRGAKQAYEEAHIGPEDVDVAEVHDAFTIAELLYYEALGFCNKGDAAKLLEDGETSIGGRIPVNPSGGLLSKGHPIGATGAAQIVEVVRQLRGQAGNRQVDGAKVALTHCTGGGISGFDHGACSIHMFSV
ncbi:MAG: propanoyl-CoA acyltransferase [Rhodospirillaceae bacterium]|nr:propanoyl-CoA acyltransferase [Rhodospirillaceae bacterium]